MYEEDATNFLPPEGMGSNSFGKFQFKTGRCNCFDDHLSCTHLVNEPHVCKSGQGSLHALNDWRLISSVYRFLGRHRILLVVISGQRPLRSFPLI